MVHKALETKYKGYRFRSRTEARWAVYFEHMGIAYDYEPEGYQLTGKNGKKYFYLPDFYLKDMGCFAEVKGDPTDFRGEVMDTIRLLAKETQKPVVCLAGRPDYRAYEVVAYDTASHVWAATFLAVITKEKMVGEMRSIIPKLVKDPKFVKAIEASRSERFGT
jgi:hypothetical protein